MREILFRGKSKGDGEWITGFLVSPGHIGDWVTAHPIDPTTVGQFIGLTDKNGQGIFEGDMLKGFQYPFYRSESDEHNYFAEVIWFPGNCAFGLYTHKHPTAKVRGISAGNADFIEDFNSDDWEVIGNIHDNPELLSEEEPNATQKT